MKYNLLWVLHTVLAVLGIFWVETLSAGGGESVTPRITLNQDPSSICQPLHKSNKLTRKQNISTISIIAMTALNISAIYKSIIIIFSVNFPLVFIYKFRKDFFKNQIQPLGEPREHRLGEVLQGRSKLKFNIILSFFFWIYLQV